MSEARRLEAACQREAVTRDQLPCQADRGGHGDLLTEHRANRELEPVPRTRNAQPWSRRDQRSEHGILGELGADRVRVGGEIEHTPHARNDRRQRRQAWKLDGDPQCIAGARLHGDNAVRPPISIVRAYRSIETTSTPGMARAFRNDAIAFQSYGGR